jgi:hypothetical protein
MAPKAEQTTAPKVVGIGLLGLGTALAIFSARELRFSRPSRTRRRDNPAVCGRRYGKLSARERKALPGSAFGLPKSREYPMPDSSHASNAKARAKTELDRGNISRAQYRRIVRKADRILQECAKDNPTSQEAYERFHWGDKPKQLRSVELPEFDELYTLGKLVSVEYETTKAGESAIWHHEFESPEPSLTATPDGDLGPIIGGGAHVTERGIEG